MDTPKYKIGDSVVLEKGLIEFLRIPELYEVIGAFYCDWTYTKGIKGWRYVAIKNRGRRHYTFWEREVIN